MLYSNHNNVAKLHECLDEQYGNYYKLFQYLAREGTTAHYKAIGKQDNQTYLIKLEYVGYEEFCTCHTYKTEFQKVDFID